MVPPFRRFAGSFGLLVFLMVYIFFALALGDVIVSTKPGWVQFLYFVVAGLLWVIPAGALIKWMYRPRRTDAS
jgi:hypothetical protein